MNIDEPSKPRTLQYWQQLLTVVLLPCITAFLFWFASTFDNMRTDVAHLKIAVQYQMAHITSEQQHIRDTLADFMGKPHPPRDPGEFYEVVP